jgi:hypothetical protein
MFPSNHGKNHLDKTATFLDLYIVSLLMVPAMSIVHLMVGPSRRAETIATETFLEASHLPSRTNKTLCVALQSADMGAILAAGLG